MTSHSTLQNIISWYSIVKWHVQLFSLSVTRSWNTNDFNACWTSYTRLAERKVTLRYVTNGNSGIGVQIAARTGFLLLLLLLLLHRPNVHSASYPMGTEYSPGIKRVKREADHLPASSIGIKNAWSGFNSVSFIHVHYTASGTETNLLFICFTELTYRLQYLTVVG